MKKIDSSQLVCTADQSAQLITLGIIPVACFCYENIAGQYEFAGEYMGQAHPLPAWTAEELIYLMGGECAKADLEPMAGWTENKNMLLFYVDFELKLKQYPSAARANADILIYMLQKEIITAAQANERLECFADVKYYNQIESKNFPKKKK